MKERAVPIVLIGLVCIAAAAFAAPAFAQGLLVHFAPRAVQALPDQPLSFEARALAPRLTDPAEFEKQAGFRLVWPTLLPAGCSLREHFFIPQAREVALVYTCMEIFEKKAEGVDSPLVGEGSIQQLSVGNTTAYYIGGAWVRMPGETKPTWHADWAGYLVFERDDVLIYLSGDGLTLGELVAVAESMRF
jgi:hypothetical protein